MWRRLAFAKAVALTVLRLNNLGWTKSRSTAYEQYLVMLYYTYRNLGRIQATYNGRLSFLRLEDWKTLLEIDQYKRGNDFDSLWTANADADECAEIDRIFPILLHEYAHKQTFRYSKLGLVLTGWRFWARVKHLYFQPQSAVRKYYIGRALYMMETEKYQEKLVYEIEALGAKSQLSKQQFSEFVKKKYLARILLTDKHILTLWKTNRCLPSLLNRALFYFIGSILQKDFAIVASSLDPSGNWKEMWISDGGVLNEVKIQRATESRQRRFRKWVFNKLRPEPLSKRQTPFTDLRWLGIAVRSQCDVLRKVYKESETELQSRLVQVTEFVLQWANVTNHEQQLYAMMEDAAVMELEDFLSLWEPRIEKLFPDDKIKKFMNFFYLHGN